MYGANVDSSDQLINLNVPLVAVAKNFIAQTNEVTALSGVVEKVLPTVIDGRFAIEVLRSEGSSNWRQMEWIGFWFEHVVETQVVPETGGSRGPTYGRTEFDFQRNFVWDLKVHLDGSDWLILNDQEAVHACLDEHAGLGYLIVEGTADFDPDGSFKAWHDQLKGGSSAYEKDRVIRGAPSRRRKTSFAPNRILAIWIPSSADASKAVKDGWLKGFQEGMRNSNGNPRRAKFQIKVSQIPPDFILFDKQI